MTLTSSSTGRRRTLPPGRDAGCERRRKLGRDGRLPVPVRSQRRAKGVSESKPPRLYIGPRLRRARRPDRRLHRSTCQPTLTPTTAPTPNHPSSRRRARQLATASPSTLTRTSRSSRSRQRTAAARSGATRPTASRRSPSTVTGPAWSVSTTRSTSSDEKRGDAVTSVIAAPSCGYDRTTGADTGCISDTHKLHIGFKRHSWVKESRTKAKLSTKRPREGGGGRFRPNWLVTYVFSRHRCKSTAPALAVGLCIGAGVDSCRAHCEVTSTMDMYQTLYDFEEQPDAGTEGSRP